MIEGERDRVPGNFALHREIRRQIVTDRLDYARGSVAKPDRSIAGDALSREDREQLAPMRLRSALLGPQQAWVVERRPDPISGRRERLRPVEELSRRRHIEQDVEHPTPYFANCRNKR